MHGDSDRITRPITLKYVIALGLLAVLSATNFLLLKSEIAGNQAMVSILATSGRQRMLLIRSAWLAERLVFAVDSTSREHFRDQLISTIEPLQKSHMALMRPDAPRHIVPDQLPAIYEHRPWSLDSEMRNYLLHLRLLIETPEEAVHFGDAHFKYVRNPERIDRILNGLDAVVEVYEGSTKAKTARLRQLAIWSLASILVLLFLNGWVVFRPMVRRLRMDVRALNELNSTLDKRVAERTEEAQRRAAELERSQEALCDSEALYRSLVNNLPMCVLRKDREGRFTFANDNLCRLVGRQHDQLVGCTDADLYTAELAAKYRADDERVMETEEVFQDVEAHRPHGGPDIYVEVLKSPLRDAAGKVIGTQTLFWDVTDRKQAEERARHAERLAAIGQMVAGVAHESRNALQQIQACSQLLEWELGQDASKSELIRELQIAQARLRRLFDDLRGYASPLKLNLGRCDVDEVLRQAWASVKLERDGRKVCLRQADGEAPFYCHADAFQLEQVFRNILENALAACQDPVHLEVRYSKVQHHGAEALRVAIRDNGPGLTPEQRQRIFEPFFTTKKQGTGLGMAIVKQIVEGHGGTIEARGCQEGGTEVSITLPQVDCRQRHDGGVAEESCV